MNDPEIRQLLFAKLAKRVSFTSQQIVEEAPISNGAIRADVVVCSNKVECFEIKSHGDSLKRLMSQATQYEQSFDLVTLVCATKHLTNAMNILPDWWGITEVTGSGKLKVISRAKKNPYVDFRGMADLLSNDESRSILINIGKGKGVRSLSHNDLKKRLEECLSFKEFRELVIQELSKRNEQWGPSLLTANAREPQLLY